MGCCKENHNHAQGEEGKSCCKNASGNSCGEGKCFCRCLFKGLFGWMCCNKKAKENCCKDHSAEKEMNGQCCKNKNGAKGECTPGNHRHGTRSDVVAGSKTMLGLLEKQIDGMSAEQLVQQPGGVKNHALWNMGHIAFALDGVIGLLGGQKTLDEKWKKLFGGGSTPVADAKAYPSVQEMKQTVMSSEAYLSAPSELLRGPNPNERFREQMPTLGNMVVFLMSAHLGEHVGQVSAWRRAMGKDPLF